MEPQELLQKGGIKHEREIQIQFNEILRVVRSFFVEKEEWTQLLQCM